MKSNCFILMKYLELNLKKPTFFPPETQALKKLK